MNDDTQLAPSNIASIHAACRVYVQCNTTDTRGYSQSKHGDHLQQQHRLLIGMKLQLPCNTAKQRLQALMPAALGSVVTAKPCEHC